jgi:hypothetical protein
MSEKNKPEIEMQPGLQRLQLTVTARQQEMLKIKAQELQISVSELVRRILDAWLEELQKKPFAPPPFPVLHPVVQPYPYYQPYPYPGTGDPMPPYAPPGTITIYSVGEVPYVVPVPTTWQVTEQPVTSELTSTTVVSAAEMLNRPLAEWKVDAVKRGPGRPKKAR